jgi:predicted transcriptional regulator
MNSSQKSLLPQAGRTIVLSIKPRYAELILAGTKTVEFRRAWAAEKVAAIAIYASAPIRKIVGVAQVSDVISAKPTSLWEYCKKRGGGLSRSELFAYMNGKPTGFAILLKDVTKLHQGIVPSSVIEGFSPPQSFRYMTPAEAQKLERLALKSRAVR